MGNMRKPRRLSGKDLLSHHHHHHHYPHWSHNFFLILLFWAAYLFALGLATRRSMNPNIGSIGGGSNSNSGSSDGGASVRIPLAIPEPRRNTLKDRLYYPPSYYNKKNTNNARSTDNNKDRPRNRGGNSGGPSYHLRNDDDENGYASSRRRGTSSIQSQVAPEHPTVLASTSSFNGNYMPRKSFEQKRNSNNNRQYFEHDNRLSTVISPVVGGRKDKKKSYPPRDASVNSILRLDPSSLSLWGDEATSVCHTIPGLTKEQMQLCFKSPDATRIALQGLNLAADECAFQMSKNRWNCSSLQGKLNPHSTMMFRKGYRESAFGHAIAAAGVAYSVAKACSQGNLLSCGCGFQYDDQVNFIPSKDADYNFDESNESSFKRWTGGNSLSSWKWSGCSHNMDYGIKFAKIFLDSREKSSDLPSRINLHNNKVGRLAVSSNLEVRCKCHGLSGSCELRTCWRSAPDFRRVGTVLKNKFRRAIMIDQSEIGNRPLNRVEKLKKQRRKRRDRTKRNSGNIDLWYYERSPTYCESNSDFSIPGTTGRRCNKTGTRDSMGSCSTLCCGRGYNTIRQVYTTRCQCQFIWCCEVTCKNCTVDEWVTVCK